MIVFDEHADGKLVKQLEAYRAEPDASRCIHFKLSQLANIALPATQQRAIIISEAERILANENPQIYICEDNDVMILAPIIPVKEAKQLMLAVGEQFAIPVTDEFVAYYELNSHVNKLLVEVESKIEARRRAIETLQKQKEEAIANRKRLSILNAAPGMNGQDIGKRRSERSAPEFMIIEDDAFSRRLVENVLQKKYAMTPLATADSAISTYARIAPDMLLLDINLPDVSGLDLLEKIIALDPDAYVIMLSGNADKDNIMQAMRAGAKGFIAKPFNREKLFQYIERCPTMLKQRSGSTNA